MSNYATKSDQKRETGVDTSKFSENADLVSLKSDTDNLHIDELKTTLVDLSKLSKQRCWLKRLYMMNYLKMLMLFRLLILIISLWLRHKNWRNWKEITWP